MENYKLLANAKISLTDNTNEYSGGLRKDPDIRKRILKLRERIYPLSADFTVLFRTPQINLAYPTVDVKVDVTEPGTLEYLKRGDVRRMDGVVSDLKDLDVLELREIFIVSFFNGQYRLI